MCSINTTYNNNNKFTYIFCFISTLLLFICSSNGYPSTQSTDYTNSGKITVTDDITYQKNFNNSGTITQTDLAKAFNLGDKDNKTYTATNTGYIRAGKFSAKNKVINQVSGYMELHTGLSFQNTLVNAGIIESIKSNDSACFVFYETTLNTGTIIARNYTAWGYSFKFNNNTINGGNILSYRGVIEFSQKAETTNTGVITSTGDARIFYTSISGYNLRSDGYMYNSGTITTKYSVMFTGTLINSGSIKQKGQTNYGKSSDIHIGFQNNGLLCTVKNIGYIESRNNLNIYGTFTNYATVISGSSQSDEFSLNATSTVNNYGYMKVIGGLTSNAASSFINSGTAELIFTIGADFEGSLNNSATIRTTGQYLKTYGNKFTNTGIVNVDGTLTIGSGGIDNSGTITTKGKLIASNKVDNSGFIDAQAGLTSDNEFINKTNAIVNITGVATFNKKFINQKQATLTVTNGLATFTTKSTNDGTIKALNGLNVESFVNSQGAILEVASADLKIKNNGSFYNSGAINIEKNNSLVVNNGNKFINLKNGVLTTNKIHLLGNGAVKFEDPISYSNMEIENEGIICLAATSTIKSYTGYDYSELVLALPKVKPKTALLTTTDASFSVGAKIILDATGQLGYLSKGSSPTITIIKATNNLTTSLTTSVDLEKSLLYSRVYGAINKTLQISSILMKITEATITNNSLTAKLQLTTAASLNLGNLSTIYLAKSLYGNYIVNGEITTTELMQTSPYPDGYVNNRINKTINEYAGLIALGTFTNPLGFSINILRGTAYFLGDVTNAGAITQGTNPIEVTATAKFLNLKSGVLTSRGLINFKGEGSNSGTISALAGLEANKFTNSKGATVTIKGKANFNQELINTGYIKVEVFISYNKVVNQVSGYMKLHTGLWFVNDLENHGTIESTGNDYFEFDGDIVNKGTIISGASSTKITIRKNLTNSGTIEQKNLTEAFNVGDSANKIYTATNTGYIKAGNLVIYGTLVNCATVVAGDVLDNKLYLKENAKVKNYGYMKVIGGLTSNATSSFINSGTAELIFTIGAADFEGSLNNSATIRTTGQYLKTYGNKFTNTGIVNVDGELTIGSGGLDNSGTITTKGKLTASNKVDNSGFIDAQAGLTSDNEFINKTNAIVNITGVATFNKKFINQKQATLTVTNGLATFTTKSTNDGTIKALNGLNVESFVNSQGAILEVASADLKIKNNGSFYNSGAINIEENNSLVVNYGNEFINLKNGVLTTNKIHLLGNGAVKFEDPISYSKMEIENEGIICLAATSTIKSYTGYDYSELVLALPKVKPKTALLTTTDASFSVGAKIILDAASKLGYLSKGSSPTITIIKATKNLTTGVTTSADLEKSLLYSRVYGAINKELQSSSILMKITEATITNNSLTAKLQLTTATSLNLGNLSTIYLAKSLYGNYIVNGEITTTEFMQTSPYPDGYINDRSNKKIKEYQGLIARGTFTNPLGFSINILGGAACFLGDVTNAGAITQGTNPIEVTATAKFLNLKSGVLTSRGLINFKGEGNNSGTISALAGLDAAKFTNSKGATVTIKGKANFNQELINTGYIKAVHFTAYNKVVNQASGYMLLDIGLSFRNIVINAGTIESTGNDGFGFSGDVVNKGTIISGATSTYITIRKNLTNSGTIEQKNLTKDFNIGDSDNKIYTATNTGYIRAGNLVIYGTLVNCATVVAGNVRNNELDLKENAKVKNYGYMNVIGGLTSNPNTSFINSGTAELIFTIGGADFEGSLNNSATIRTTDQYLKTYGNEFTNTGIVNVDGELTIGSGGLDNSGTVVAKTLKGTGLVNNSITKAIAKFTEIVNDSTIKIKNQGSLELQGGSAIGSYDGNTTSELVLTLPSTKPTSSLVTVTNDATFDAGAKIILTATTSLSYLMKPTRINIVTANTLTVHGTVDELLYSRVYHNNNEVKYSTGPTLQLGSMLIEIENATSSIGKSGNKDYLVADLKLVNLAQNQLSNYQTKLTSSLLDNVLYNKRITTKPATAKSTAKLQQRLEVVHHKPLDSNFTVVNNVMEDNTIELPQQLQKSKKLKFDNINYNLWSSIGYYSGAYTHNKWQEVLLCIGSEAHVDTMKLGAAFAYLDTTMSADNQPKTKISSYHLVVHAIKYIDNINVRLGGIYSRIDNKQNGPSNVFAVATIGNYKYVIDKFNIDLAINSRLMNVSPSTAEYDEKASKSFMSVGSSVRVTTTVAKLYDIPVDVSLHSGYDYTTELTSKSETIVANITTAKIKKHMLYTKLKASIDYNNWFYGMSFNYSHASKQNIYGCSLVAGYRF